MAENEKKAKFEHIGYVQIDGRVLRIDFFGADGKSIDVDKRCFVFIRDVSELILDLSDSPSGRLYKWRNRKSY